MKGQNVTLETPDFLKWHNNWVERQQKRGNWEKDTLFSDCGCHRRFPKTATEIRSTRRRRSGQPSTSLIAPKAGFSATGAPLLGQITYPAFSLLCVCVCVCGQRQTCSLSQKNDKAETIKHIETVWVVLVTSLSVWVKSDWLFSKVPLPILSNHNLWL